MRIGELAQESGVSVPTLRFYEAQGVLEPATRSESGYRLYGPESLARLRFVRQAQALGLRLSDIATIIRIREGGEMPCGHVAALVEAQLDEVNRQIEELQLLRADLSELSERLRTEQREAGDAICPCIEGEPVIVTPALPGEPTPRPSRRGARG
jgi:DNA-binding transcriptional MerR regulator